MEFPTLYKLNKSGKYQTWNIYVSKKSDSLSLIIRKYGIEGGSVTESVKEINKGKNIGKSNETSVFEQACAEARSIFKKQSETYSTTKNMNSTKPKPMLAHMFDKQSHKIVYPAFVQPKLDGVRMIAHVDPNSKTVTCLSRTGKEYTSNSLQYVCDALLKLSVPNGVWFDGELYSDHLTFEEIVGICRNTLHPDADVYKKLEYHVYDFIPNNTSDSFTDRLNLLNMLPIDGVVRRVFTTTVESTKDVYTKHDEFAEKGYEGIMVRNKNGKYAQNRSYDLQKYKNFQDDEFQIVDIKEAVGNDKGTVILQCQTNDKKPFWVRPRGTREYRTHLLTSHVVGKWLTVRFQNWTEKGIPRFPVGLTIRDYE